MHAFAASHCSQHPMIGLLQRVSQARVEVEGSVIAAIGPGLMVLVCAERGDGTAEADRLLDRLLNYRVFSDGQGKMNRSLRDIGGDLMLVPQFTLAADTSKGHRPSFTPAAAPEQGRLLFEHMLASAKQRHPVVAGGRFGADMQITLTNDGPVTIWLRVSPTAGSAQNLR